MAVNLVLPVGIFPAAGVKAERLDGIMPRGHQDCADNWFELIAAFLSCGGIAASTIQSEGESTWLIAVCY
jgi:hypothetical protein